MGRTSYTIGFRVQPRFRVISRHVDRKIDGLRRAIEDVIYQSGPLLTTVAGVVDTTRGVEIAIGDAFFIDGSAELSDVASNELAAIGDAVRKRPLTRIAIDLRPRLVRACAGAQLTQQRALVLRDKLVEAGVGDVRSIEVLGLAEIGSAASATGECRAATITIVGVSSTSTAAVP